MQSHHSIQPLILPIDFLILILVGDVISTGIKKMEETYWHERSLLLQEVRQQLLGSSLILADPREILVNKILMSFKEREFQDALNTENHSMFPSSKHFFHSKKLIDKSNVFKIIQMLPKGANLHSHLSLAVKTEFIVNTITKWPNLYYCIKNGNHLLFQFADKELQGCSSTDSWKSIEELRSHFPSEDMMSQWLLSNMSMATKTPEGSLSYPDTNTAWIIFEKKIVTVLGVLGYEKALRSALYNALLDHYNDNILYAEIRATLGGTYWLNQTLLTEVESFQLFIDVVNQFQQDYPDFFGAKFIFAPRRRISATKMNTIVDTALKLKEKFPRYFIGFDLVGQEDKGSPLIDLLPSLLEAASKDIQFFFHAGETSWFGTQVDENLVDAVLLNTTRIAHGYALFRYPKLMEIAKSKNIAVEVCPISNQILRYVEDFRVHPGTTYLRDGFPVVIASDNPGIFGTKALSHDWHVAFMALGGRLADLAFLKQLALNSIKYSALNSSEKSQLEKQWEIKWSEFLDKVIKEYGK